MCRNTWNLVEAEKNLLRTHTTAISAQMLYRLASRCRACLLCPPFGWSCSWICAWWWCLRDKFEPKKYFSIDRVFRNETLDATHLAEFHQVRPPLFDLGTSSCPCACHLTCTGAADRGPRGGQEFGSGRPHGDDSGCRLLKSPHLRALVVTRGAAGPLHPGLLREAGPARDPLQAHVQPLHGAVNGNLPLAPRCGPCAIRTTALPLRRNCAW